LSNKSLKGNKIHINTHIIKPSFHVRFGQCAAALSTACALFWGAVAQAQPTVSTIYPDGAIQFQHTNTLAFTISSATSVNPSSISVHLAATNLDGTVTSQLLTATNGLTITGSATSRVVTTPLASNTVYTAIIQATDSTGDLVTTNDFDTITPSYTWEGEDWDYEGGKFIDNPQTNAYSGLQGVINVDAFNPNNGGAAYRPVAGTGSDGDLGNETCGDKPRAQYADLTYTDYDQGWNNGGSGLWGNYTRHYPVG
jgi:hypothetical protein